MKEYLFLFRGGDAANLQKDPEKMKGHREEWAKWMAEMGKQGKFVSAQPLDQTGMQVLGPKKAVTDGPFMEGKEIVAGYLICKADSYADAVESARGCPVLQFDNGKVEVRAIREL